MDGVLEGIVVSNAFLVLDPAGCHSGFPPVYYPGFTTPPAWQDTMTHAVPGSPAGVLFVRGRYSPMDPMLPPGSDGAVPSLRLIVDAGNAAGVFEIDTTCTAQNNHLVYVRSDVSGVVPSFTKGVITISGGPGAACDCARDGDIEDDGTFDALDVMALIDYVFSSGNQPLRDPTCPHIDRGDVNCDGVDDVFDIVHLIDFVFRGGPAPCDPCLCALEWIRRYDNPSGWNRAEAVVVGASGMICVAGSNIDIAGTRPPYYVTILTYSPNGGFLWDRQEYILGDVMGAHLAADSHGHVYVAASEQHGGGGGYLTMKYDSSGTLLWRTTQYFQSGHCYAEAVALDSQGNVFVTGRARGTDLEPYDYGTLKYDSAGSLLWERHFGPGIVSAIAVDAAGNSYVTGSAGTVKHDPSGAKLWKDPEPGSDIVIDAGGNNVYVTGSSTRKFDSGGNLLWSDPCTGATIRTDAAGNVYTAGSAIRKYDADGYLQWEDPTAVVAMEVSAAGSVFVTGSSTASYDTDGHLLWRVLWPGVDLGIDTQGNVYTTNTVDGDFITTKISNDNPCDPPGSGVAWLNGRHWK
jgi:hypothetical protein